MLCEGVCVCGVCVCGVCVCGVCVWGGVSKTWSEEVQPMVSGCFLIWVPNIKGVANLYETFQARNKTSVIKLINLTF